MDHGWFSYWLGKPVVLIAGQRSTTMARAFMNNQLHIPVVRWFGGTMYQVVLYMKIQLLRDVRSLERNLLTVLSQ